MDLDGWNKVGRAKNESVCKAFDEIIDRDGSTDEDLAEDARSEELADAVLAEVVALNTAGTWHEARGRFDPAHLPFVPHMDKTDLGLSAVVFLAPDSFLVRRGEAGEDGLHVLHVDGDVVKRVDGVTAFALSRDRKWLVLARKEGLAVSRGWGGAKTLVPWPKGVKVDPRTIETLEIANDGRSLVFASDASGIWLVQGIAWTKLAPRPGVGEDEDEEDEEDEEDDDEEEEEEKPARARKAPAKVAAKAKDDDEDDADEDEEDEDDADEDEEDEGDEEEEGDEEDESDEEDEDEGDEADDEERASIDVTHVAISPDGKYVAYGWQDAPGHYVDKVEGGRLEHVGVVGTLSDYTYRVRFTDDSKELLSNSRHMQSGGTVCITLKAIKGLEPYDDLPEKTARTDEYLRANGMTVVPGEVFGVREPVVWIGGAGWSHAAPLHGGKPVFTQFLGSSLDGFDYDPASKRVAIASSSGMLHVFAPGQRAEAGRERGYKPRRELYRWIFWDTLKAPIRW